MKEVNYYLCDLKTRARLQAFYRSQVLGLTQKEFGGIVNLAQSTIATHERGNWRRAVADAYSDIGADLYLCNLTNERLSYIIDLVTGEENKKESEKTYYKIPYNKERWSGIYGQLC